MIYPRYGGMIICLLGYCANFGPSIAYGFFDYLQDGDIRRIVLLSMCCFMVLIGILHCYLTPTNWSNYVPAPFGPWIQPWSDLQCGVWFPKISNMVPRNNRSLHYGYGTHEDEASELARMRV